MCICLYLPLWLYVCVCLGSSSYQWYSWGPPNMQCRLCASCWTYWKKYGGLKLPTRLDGERPGPNRNMVHANTHRKKTQADLLRKIPQKHTVHMTVLNLILPPEPSWSTTAAQWQPQVCSEDATGLLPADHWADADGSPPLPGHHQATTSGQAPLPPCQHSSHQGRM